MQIAFLIGELRANAGQTNNLIEITKFILKHKPGWQLTVFAHRVYSENLFDSKVNVREIKSYYSSLISNKKLTTELKKFDLAYIKGNFPYLMPAKRANVKTILVVHHRDSPKLFSKMSDKMKVFGTNLLIGFMVKIADSVVTVSSELKDYYRIKYSIDAVVIEDQISNIFFKTRGSSVKSGNIINFLSVGYWDGKNGRKRQHMLLDLFSRLKGSMPQFTLTFSGLDRVSLTKLGEISDNYGLTECVKLKGILSMDELQAEYQSNDIYVTATTYEGFYRQIVEAFASGMPAIVYDSRPMVDSVSQCASVNHVIKSNAGLLFSDFTDLSSAIRTVLDNYEVYSKNAIEYSKNFSPQITGKKTLDLIENMVNNSRN